ncbi:MAG: GTP cyclohydrolase I FolE [Muribaculaceae bacterium]
MNEEIKKLSDNERIELIAGHLDKIITLLGEDVSREGLVKTPMRAAKALYYLTSGYRTDASRTLAEALFEHEGSKIVTVRDIEFYSMCEHHVLPFFGHISIAYIPDKKIVGLSKLARVVNVCARKLQVQERLTSEVANVISRTLGAKGVLVVCDARHMCMMMRGVEKQESTTVTVEYTGLFDSDSTLRREAIEALKH